MLELLLSEHCSKCVCVLGWIKCREHISLVVILCIIVYVEKKIYYRLSFFFFQNRYPIMVKYLNIGKNIGKPIYLSISKNNVNNLFSSMSVSAVYSVVVTLLSMEGQKALRLLI